MLRSILASASLAFAALMLASGCNCAGNTTGNCFRSCGDAESACPEGTRCVAGCCQCTPVAEICDGRDQSCDGVADDGLEASCACAPGGPGPGAEVCNGIDDDCNGAIDDGVTIGEETCNGADDDCDGTIDEGLDPARCPCAPGGAGASDETCNGVDDDCDGTIDEGLDPARCPCAPGGAGPSDEVCNGADDDCDGVADDGLDPTLCACAPGGPGPGPERCNARDDDCNEAIDDGTMACGGASLCACAEGGRGPSEETCNGVDDDCDGTIDDGLDACACTSCGVAGAEECNRLDDDCNGMIDEGLDPVLCPCAPGGAGPSVEVCNGADDDCDGAVDDGLTACACAPGGPGPGAETCNGVDDDCDGIVDEGVAACACAPGGAGRSMEVCNRVDDDCNGMIDEIDSRTGMPCRGFGEPCTANTQCSSTLCGGDVFDRYCTERCTPGADPAECGAGYRCWDNPSLGGVDQCRRDYAACRRDADCASGEVCAATCDDTGTSVVTECRPAIPGGRDAPMACTRGSECAGNDCRTGICTEICASDADCAAGHRCVLLRHSGCGGRGYVARCLDACDCDAECPAGQLCQPFVHEVLPPDTRTTMGACDISYGPLGPGEDCDNSMGLFCAHAICSRGGTGFCTQVCSATCGCPLGIGPCGPTTVTFPDLGSFPAMTCATP